MKQIKKCITFSERFVGLMFTRKPITFGLQFDHCDSIHTFFMFQSIDVIMTDKNGIICHLYPRLKPWRIVLPKRNVFTTYEVPLGTCQKWKVGDRFSNE